MSNAPGDARKKLDISQFVTWAVEQQAVAVASVAHNKPLPIMRGCRLCGRTDTATVYRLGRSDWCVCADHEACTTRQEALLT